MKNSRRIDNDDRHMDDPMLGGRSSVASVLREARASLKQPTRPVTPAEHRDSRKLFNSNQYAVRPSSSHGNESLSKMFNSNMNIVNGKSHSSISNSKIERKKVTTASLEQQQRPLSGRKSRVIDEYNYNRRRLQPLNPLNPYHPSYHPKPQQQQHLQQQQQSNSDRIQTARTNGESMNTNPDNNGLKSSNISKSVEQYQSKSEAEVLTLCNDSRATSDCSDEGIEQLKCNPSNDMQWQLQPTNEETSFVDKVSHSIAELCDSQSYDRKKDIVDDIVAFVERARRDIEGQRWFNKPVAFIECNSKEFMGNGASIRETILQSMIKLMDARDAQLILKASLAMILISSEGSENATASIRPLWKNLFTLTKDTVNDSLFRRERLLMPLLNILCYDCDTTIVDVGKKNGNVNGCDIKLLVSPFDKIYIAGGLKNLSIDESNQISLDRAGAKSLLLSLLSSLALGFSSSGQHELSVQLAVQVTALLRNLLSSKEKFEEFYKSKSKTTNSHTPIDVFATLLLKMAENDELALNVSRIFSRMSSEESLCKGVLFNHKQALASIVHCLRAQKHNGDVVVRLCYVLGNGTEDSEKIRVFLARSTGLLDTIAASLQYFIGKLQQAKLANDVEKANDNAKIGCDDDREVISSTNSSFVDTNRLASEAQLLASSQNHEEAKKEGKQQMSALFESIAEVLVKQIRLIANMAISIECGATIAKNNTIAESLTTVMEICKIHQRGRDCQDGTSYIEEELVLNTVSAITNITFYDIEEVLTIPELEDDPHRQLNRLLAKVDRINPALLTLLFCDNDEAVIEAARAIGNITRDQGIRARLIDQCDGTDTMNDPSAVGRATLQALVILLDHGNRDVIFAVVGCLMNLVADDRCIRILKEFGCTPNLTEVLSWSIINDIPIACVVIKAIYNIFLFEQDCDEECKVAADDTIFDLEYDSASEILSILDRVPPPGTKLSGSPTEEEDPDINKVEIELWDLAQQLGQKVKIKLEAMSEICLDNSELEPLSDN